MAKKRRAVRVAKQAAPQKKMPVWIWFAIGGVVSILVVAGLFYLGFQGVSAGSSIEGLEFFPDSGRGHQEGEIDYGHDELPHGGVHSSAWQNCGIYDEPIREENAVHSLEHGAVWVAYQPDLAENQVEFLRDLVRQERRNRGESMVLLSPKADLEAPIVAVAWRVQLILENASDPRLQEFLNVYQRGPFTPEPGAACTNGIGTPLN